MTSLPAGNTARPLAEHRFTAQDQDDFAAASADVNPMHVDPVVARRLISGRQVVHGIHGLLMALDAWSPPTGVRVKEVQCIFDQPISVGDEAQFIVAEGDAQGAVLTARVRDVVCTTVTITLATDGPPPAAAAVGAADAPRRRIDRLSAPLEDAPGSQAGTVDVLPPWGEALASHFPNAARVLGAGAVATLGRLSFYVGMVCPGLHSVFSSLRFSPTDLAAPDAELELLLKRYDSRFKLFIVDFDGALQGQLRAFLRPPPQPQPGTRELMAYVRAGEFSGTRALVVGGSRGLGEMTAKLLGAGGGEVIVSYAVGEADARRVADDITAAGQAAAGTLHLDLSADRFQTPAIEGPLDAVYYFATPRIFKKKVGLFDTAHFDDFCRFYLRHFVALCLWLEARADGRPVTVYLPSTVFVTERPKGMTEYAMAKAAAEVLADELTRGLTNVFVLHTRLPRLATDQTSSILGLTMESNVQTLLPVVRRVMRRG